jgi:hypothetical protein
VAPVTRCKSYDFLVLFSINPSTLAGFSACAGSGDYRAPVLGAALAAIHTIRHAGLDPASLWRLKLILQWLLQLLPRHGRAIDFSVVRVKLFYSSNST